MDASSSTPSPAARQRATLQEVVAALAWQIASSYTVIVDDMWVDPRPYVIDLADLRRLLQLCEDRSLPVEAARIRRWLAA